MITISPEKPPQVRTPMPAPIDAVLSRLNATKSGSQWAARCLAHEDRQASLSIAVGNDGRVLLNCHAGCATEKVVSALGLTMRDLMPSGNGHATKPKKEPPKFAHPITALRNLEQIMGGPHSALWEYHDAAGNVVGMIVRWDRPNGKIIRPISKYGDSWLHAGMPEPRPLCNLPALRGANRVYLGEGEKVVEAAKSIGLVATTSPHGAKSAAKADWIPLAGKEIVGIRDNDAAGLDYMNEVGRIVWGLSPRPSFRIVTLPGLAEGEDLVEWIDHHGDAAEPDSMREEIEAVAAATPEWTPPPETVTTTKPTEYLPIAPGTIVYATDKGGNFGDVVADLGDSCSVHFKNPDTGDQATVTLPKSQLRTGDGRRLDGSGPAIPEPCTLTQLMRSYPALRPAAIDGLLRIGETMNVVAPPKQGKSWLTNGLELSVASGGLWLGTFRCVRGPVLIIDAELHPEVIAHRLPAVADAMDIERAALDSIDVLPLRGCGVDLLTLQPFIESVEPGRYALVVLDAWYRFLPPGFSENDNAQVMALYNRIDGYAAHLQSAWVNVHHASKGDQSGKSTTDVGSGAGSQSRAADTHLVIRSHEEENVAVVEAAVRSWPPVAPFAIRWTYPVWRLDSADPRKLRRPRDKATKESSDVHLDEDRQAIVNAMVAFKGPETMTAIRNATRVRDPRFGFAWSSLERDGTVTPAGEVKKPNGQRYPAYTVAPQEAEA